MYAQLFGIPRKTKPLMSRLQRDLLFTKVHHPDSDIGPGRRLPHPQLPDPPGRLGPSEGLRDASIDEAEEARDTFGGAGGSMPPPQLKLPRRSKRREGFYTPLSAAGYFEEALSVTCADRNLSLRAYLTPPRPKDAAKLPAFHPDYVDDDDTSSGEHPGTLVVCVHGAGYSGLAWAAFAKEVRERTDGELGVLAYDGRGHGSTTSILGDPTAVATPELTLEGMSADLIALLSTLYPDPASRPSFILVGHSMGGAVATCAVPLLQAASTPNQVLGLVVLDVVEGSAMEALSGMEALVASRPRGFPSKEAAISWHIRSNTLRNPGSARISVPSLVYDSEPDAALPGEPATVPPKPQGSDERFRWRLKLEGTQPYWEGWFKGMSSRFLGAKTAKLLVLAGTDRLDKELMIGQMQGKYQLVVLQDVGHCLHEDNPSTTAATVIDFWRRNERVTIPVRKLGELGGGTTIISMKKIGQ